MHLSNANWSLVGLKSNGIYPILETLTKGTDLWVDKVRRSFYSCFLSCFAAALEHFLKLFPLLSEAPNHRCLYLLPQRAELLWYGVHAVHKGATFFLQCLSRPVK